MNAITVLILAGGEGTRFYPFTTDKILFPLLGKSLADYSIQHIIPKQATNVVIIANEKNYDYFSNATFSCPHSVLKQTNSLGMADAILTAKEEIKDSQLLILIADDYFDANLPANILAYKETHEVFGVLPGWESKTYFPGGYLQLEGDRIINIIEKPGEGKTPSSKVNISSHYISDSNALIKKLLETKSEEDDVYEKSLASLMKEHVFHVMSYEGPFASLKYPWHVLSVMELMLHDIQEFRGEHIIIKDFVTIEGPVYIGNNVKIMEYTKIVGPCYIGDNTIIGNNNVIRHSYIGKNCVTGFNTDITRSYVGDSCWFHSNYIGDSVLEGNVSMGSGSVLANLRLDEGDISSVVKNSKIKTGRNKLGALIGKNVRIGVNTSTMPGIKIGTNSMVGAGLTVGQDIPAESFVLGNSTLTIQQNEKVVGEDREQFKKNI